MEESLPPGFRFHPTDEELITYYLARKVSDSGFITRAIRDVDFNKCEPWELPGKASMGEKEWYFFSLKDRKYPTGLRTNRATEAGYWKTTGKDKEIFNSGMVFGMKKTLVFYKGRAPRGEKTNWVMHEYRQLSKYPYKPTKEEWVVCRVFQKNATNNRPPMSPPVSNSANESSCEDSMVNELGEIDIPNMSEFLSPSSGFAPGSTTNFNSELEMNTNMNWDSSTSYDTNQCSWPSIPVTSTTLANPMILRALQLNQQQQEKTTNILNSMAMQVDDCFRTQMSQLASSSSKDTTDQEQQRRIESIWRNC